MANRPSEGIQPWPCPICSLPGGFHDHGDRDSRHDAHEVPRRLLIRSEPVARVRLTDEQIAELREAARLRREVAHADP